ncbi:hypothetical protein ABS71_03570 [bacterium SCN 62-11]|nr:MAG: hypothetical protein ABS71_03570 [bacterium SCN 62-11]
MKFVPQEHAVVVSPRLEAYRQAVDLGAEGEWESGLSLYEEILETVDPKEVLLAQMAARGRAQALQNLERYEESWEGLTDLLQPGGEWFTTLEIVVDWLQTAMVTAAHCNQGPEAAQLLHFWHQMATSYPDWNLWPRFEELTAETYQAMAEHDVDEAVDWLDEIRLEWEQRGLLPFIRLLLIEGLSELLEFEDAVEEAEGAFVWARRQNDEAAMAEWKERIENLRADAVDPYNLARRGDRRGLVRLGKVNQLGRSGRNALMGAVVSNDLELAEWLLERNAHPNLIASDGWSPLLLAADHDHAEMVSLLARWKADLEATNDLDQTSLHVAAWQNHLETARVLLELGIDVNYCDSDGNTALHLAAGEAVPEMIELLVTVLPVDARNEFTEATPLMVAAESDIADNLELLIRLGADSQARDLEGRRALEYAKLHEAKAAGKFLRKLAKDS